MEELRLREEEVQVASYLSNVDSESRAYCITCVCVCVFQSRRLQQEEDALMSRRLEVEQMEEDRRRAEETRKKSEFG